MRAARSAFDERAATKFTAIRRRFGSGLWRAAPREAAAASLRLRRVLESIASPRHSPISFKWAAWVCLGSRRADVHSSSNLSQRKSIHLRGFAHRNPIPAACRLGPLLMSGSILPRHADGSSPATLAEQCALMFRYVQEIMEEAGGTTDHIVKVNVAMKDASEREVLNKHWVAMFPDSATRPARHTETRDLPGDILVQCDIVAMIDE